MVESDWMQLALDESRVAMEAGELPIASVLVGDGLEVSRGQTQAKRRGSIAAHGELFAILNGGFNIYGRENLTIYTTLEPCLMCVGACMQAGVGRIVYGMRAAPDGATEMMRHLASMDFEVPRIEGGLMELEEVALMKEFLIRYPESLAVNYVKDMLTIY